MKKCVHCECENEDYVGVCVYCGGVIETDEKFDSLLKRNKQLEVDVKQSKKIEIKLPKIRMIKPAVVLWLVFGIVVVGIIGNIIESLKSIPYSNQYAQESSEQTEETEVAQETSVASEYILPDSNSRYLTNADLEGLSAEQLRIARNEIYARHGRKFTDAGLQAHFNSCSWYSGTVEPDAFAESMLNAYEVANRDLIVAYETVKGYR